MEHMHINDRHTQEAAEDARSRAMAQHPTAPRWRRQSGSLTAEYGLVTVGAATCVGVLVKYSDNIWGDLLKNVVGGVRRLLGF